MSFWVAGASVVGAVGGALLSSQGNKKAADKAAQGSENALGEYARQFNTIQRNTAPWRSTGVQALNDINAEFGYAPSSASFGPMTPGESGADLYEPKPQKEFFNNGAGAILNPYTLTSKLGDARYVLDPAGKLFGNLFGHKHGDEKRNLKAFLNDNKIYDLGNGTLAFEDGRTFNQDQLQHIAGTYYGAQYAPDGDQESWKQRYDSLLGTLQKPAAQNAENASPGTAIAPGAPAIAGKGFMASPDYAFRRAEGNRGIERTAAARGGAFSGNALKALTEFNSNLASGEYNNWFNKRAVLAGLGQTATSQENQAALYTGAQTGNALQNQGDARASGVVGRYNGLGNALSEFGQAAGYYFGNRGSSNPDPSGIGYFKPTVRRV